MEPVKVVIRYKDGKVLKGFTKDFFPNKMIFHFQPQEQTAGESVMVKVVEMKAVFFVKDFTGNADFVERNQFNEGDRPTGRKVKIIFYDGEVLVGTTMGYEPKRIGFFMIPSDSESNNLRVFVVNDAVKEFHYL